jgi:histidine phosphotransferase ChpT
MPHQHDLASLVGSRLCHDLIGPIGAIGNGVELMLLPGNARNDEVAMIAESVSTLTARIRYYRIAFGTSQLDQSISRNEVLAMIADLFPSGRITITWVSPTDLPRAEVKAVFLLILCAEQGLRSTGRIHVIRDGSGWSLALSSPRLVPDEARWSLLSNAGGLSVSPAEVQFPLAYQAISSLDRKVRLEPGFESLRISF